jgi:hypothetical protein
VAGEGAVTRSSSAFAPATWLAIWRQYLDGGVCVIALNDHAAIEDAIRARDQVQGRVDAGGAVRRLDVLVKRQRTIVLFTPVTDDAREWFAANVVSELWQWRGPTLAADLRPACDLLDGIRRRRLRIQVVV